MHPSVISSQNLIDLKILIVIAACLLLSPYIAKFLRLPLSATEIVLGAFMGYFGFIGVSENFKILADVGFYYLMFIAGMEVNLQAFFNMEKSLLKRSLFYIAMLYLSSFVLVLALGFDSIFILIIPAMSVGLLSMLFKDFGKQCYWLNASMLSATLAEVVSIVLLTIVGAFLHEDFGIIDAGRSILYLSIFLGLCILSFKFLEMLFWWYPQLKIILMPREDKNEKDIRFCFAIFILIIVAMIVTKLEIVLGSFIAGSFIATFFNHKKDLEHKISHLGYGFLIPVFFIYIGSTFDLKTVLEYKILLFALLIMFVMFALRLCCAFIFTSKIGFKNTILFALSHSMPLTLLIAIASLSYVAKVISKDLYSALILTALFEAVVIMSLIKFISSYKRGAKN